MAHLDAQLLELEKQSLKQQLDFHELREKLDNYTLGNTGGDSDAVEYPSKCTYTRDEVLVKLNALKAIIEQDKRDAEGAIAARDELQEENERLRKQVDKLQYQVDHLKKTCDELEVSNK